MLSNAMLSKTNKHGVSRRGACKVFSNFLKEDKDFQYRLETYPTTGDMTESKQYEKS